MNDLEFKQKYLDTKSPSFCAAKWYNATIWLGSGMTTSCHHPPAHKIDIEKVKNNPKLLHNTPQKKQDRAKMIAGERPKGCQSCWQEEDAGKTSKRQNSIYKMKQSLTDWTPNSEPTLKFIDFKLGNVCNLKCRICGSWSSSKWAQEEMDYGENPVALKIYVKADGQNVTHSSLKI